MFKTLLVITHSTAPLDFHSSPSFIIFAVAVCGQSYNSNELVRSCTQVLVTPTRRETVVREHKTNDTLLRRSMSDHK